MMMTLVSMIKFRYLLRINMKQNFKSHKKNGFENLKNAKTLIEYSSNMQDVYKNIEECNLDRESIV